MEISRVMHHVYRNGTYSMGAVLIDWETSSSYKYYSLMYTRSVSSRRDIIGTRVNML